MRTKLWIGVIISAALALPASTASGREPPAPRLVVQITVDQLRADLVERVMDRLEPGGFRLLYEHGAVYATAHHGHANTETIVGHTTLATGADPSVHGMVGNTWLDLETGQLTYNIEDDRYPLLTAGAGVDQATEIDPTQKAASTQGRSPDAILVSTLSDELALFTDGQSKIFGVSVKDRGAVSMAGHAGKAFWFSKAAGEFVTSSYYYDAYPAWVAEFNAQRPAAAYGGTEWELLRDRSDYLFGDKDDMPWETDLPGYGRVFPHSFGDADGRLFTTLLTLSPVGDRLTLDFAKAVVRNEELGADDVPDYLSISFSSTDYVGHVFGPSSLESEDCLLRLDRMLAELFAFIDDVVGLDRTVVVLSADHGAAEAPGRLAQFGINAEYFEPLEIDRQAAIEALKKRFGIGEELVAGFHHPYLYLNREVIKEKALDPDEVARAVADQLNTFNGVSLALPSIDLREGRVPDTAMVRSILRNYNPKRSGDIYLVLDPHWFINDFDGLTVATSHGSPWRYDSYVPVVFMGPGIKAARYVRGIETVDVAPTLSRLLRIKAPSGARGEPLIEVFGEGVGPSPSESE
jgi:predicted AlkP superfamily pyrophosphatase or phosphodiesterase